MEHINFGIDKHSQIKANDHNQAQCIHCRSPAPYIVQPDNRDADDEVSVCGYCVHYYRMNELGENDKVIFTAGLQAKWISHLQKAIQSAKNSGKTEKVKQAEQLEQWLFAHAKFVAASQWGTDSPVAIDAAVERTLPTKRKLVFSELSLALSDETLFSVSVGQASPPINSWKDHLAQFNKLRIDAQVKGQGSNNA